MAYQGYPSHGSHPTQPGYGSPQPPFGSPYPPQQYPPYPQQSYPPQQPYPPPQGHNASFYGASGTYPPQPPQGPPPNQFYSGAPGYAQPTPPSLGYVPGQTAPGDFGSDEHALYKAMKGFGTDEAVLIDILSRRDPLQMASIRNAFGHRHSKSLESWIEGETSGHFRDGLLALVRGPLEQDAYNVNRAVRGLGTKEVLLNDVVLGRSNADLNAIKQEFHRLYHRSMDKEVSEDLSMKTQRMFSMVLAARRAEESAPVIPQEIDRDVLELHKATEARVGADQLTVCQILTSKSDGQLRALALAYEQRYRIKLEKVIAKEFSGHMEHALLMIVRGGADRAMRDAMLLEDAMHGVGTKDDLLVNRVIRIHWDRNHLTQVKGAYRHRYGQELAHRIRGETSGDYQRLLLACVQ